MDSLMKEMLAKHGYELASKLSTDGKKELKIGIARDGYFRFFPRDIEVFNAWCRKYVEEPVPLPHGGARKLWKQQNATDREPEDYFDDVGGEK